MLLVSHPSRRKTRKGWGTGVYSKRRNALRAKWCRTRLGTRQETRQSAQLTAASGIVNAATCRIDTPREGRRANSPGQAERSPGNADELDARAGAVHLHFLCSVFYFSEARSGRILNGNIAETTAQTARIAPITMSDTVMGTSIQWAASILRATKPSSAPRP